MVYGIPRDGRLKAIIGRRGGRVCRCIAASGTGIRVCRCRVHRRADRLQVKPNHRLKWTSRSRGKRWTHSPQRTAPLQIVSRPPRIQRYRGRGPWWPGVMLTPRGRGTTRQCRRGVVTSLLKLGGATALCPTAAPRGLGPYMPSQGPSVVMAIHTEPPPTQEMSASAANTEGLSARRLPVLLVHVNGKLTEGAWVAQVSTST